LSYNFATLLAAREKIYMSTPPRLITFTDDQLQRKFKHAHVLGIAGNYNQSNAQAFADALHRHVTDNANTQIIGTYRNQPVIHYYNTQTRINVMTSPSGVFISLWQLSTSQDQNLRTRGSL
jgi:hypothetical protein